MENEDKIITSLPVSLYGQLEKFESNETISKGRCRIFYKGGNRNGTFITDEFAEKLLATIPYTPVKGIYDNTDEDFTDHGGARTEGRIYGIVPQDPHMAWERHLDEDGVEREYACVDVLIYTALYKEAEKIIGKSQSMELYPKSIQGNWKIINGKKYYVYDNASFLGLQALGDEVEPCFEGAAFYSLYQSLKDLVGELEKHNPENNNGGMKMDSITFKLSDNAKYNALWSLLNSYDAETGWSCGYSITEVYDDYAIAFNHEAQEYERIYYIKNDETDSIEITQKKRCYIIDVTENEKSALETLRALNGETFEKVDEVFSAKNAEIENLNGKILEESTKNEECNNTIATLTMERDEAINNGGKVQASLEEVSNAYELLKNELTTLTAEKEALASYKKTNEDNAKLAVINGYENQLSDELLNSYKNSLDSYTIEELDMKLTYELKKANPNMFSNNPAPAYVPKASNKSALESILDRYV